MWTGAALQTAAEQISVWDALGGEGLPWWVAAIWGAALGAALGSYLGAAWWRLPRRRSMRGRSHCPGCGRQLGGGEMIPVVSYISLRGRSSCCDQPLSRAYWMWELSATVAGGALGVLLGPGVWMAVAVGVMLAVAAGAELRSRGGETRS